MAAALRPPISPPWRERLADLDRFLAALTLGAGYNVTVVTLGAGMLGAAAGASGAFMFLRKRALVSDAISHATLPGLCLAFLAMVALGADGRWLPGLLAGATLSAALGLVLVDAMARWTRLTEDAAIGAVLSVFFGLGIVLMTVIQGLGAGRAAGLEDFLLGSTAGMLAEEAWLIAAAGAASAAAVWALRRPMTLVAFDPGYAAVQGVRVPLVDLAVLALALGVTVVGLKVAGLILIVALLIIPPAAARFWTDRVDRLILLAAGIGAAAAWIGAAISAVGERLPTGPVIVLAAFALFAVSLLFAPLRGALAAARRHRRFQIAVHRRQGLLALARGEPIYERLTLSILHRAGFIQPDGVATADGRAAAARAAHDEARWAELRRREAVNPGLLPAGAASDGLTPVEAILTADQLAALDRDLAARVGPAPEPQP